MISQIHQTTQNQESVEVLTIHVIKRDGKYTAWSEERRTANSDKHATYSVPFGSALSAARGCIDRIDSFGRPRGRGRPPRGYWIARSLR